MAAIIPKLKKWISRFLVPIFKPLIWILLPCVICLWKLFQWRQAPRLKARNERLSGLRANRSYPKPPFDVRQRQLLEEYSLTENPQHQCQLLAKLPIELRRMIWTYCLTDVNLDFTIRDTIDGYQHLCVRSRVTMKLLSLPLTCRMIYREALPILFSENTVSVGSEYTMQHLHKFLPAPSINSIQSLKVAIRVDSAPRLSDQSERFRYINHAWIEVCERIADMGGLKCLDLTLHAYDTYVVDWKEQEAALFSLFESITAPSPWDLRVNWPESGTGNQARQTPYKLSRTYDKTWIAVLEHDASLRGRSTS